MSEKSSKDILASIREGDAKFLEWLYADNRQSFIFWAAQTYNCTEDMAVEVYQKAFTILYTNARDGKLKELTSTVKTYLFSIGKNLFREQFRSKHNQTLQIDDIGHSIIEGSNLDHKLSDQYQSNHHKKLVSSLLDEIGLIIVALFKLWSERRGKTWKIDKHETRCCNFVKGIVGGPEGVNLFNNLDQNYFFI